ncbi:MAG: hypothetical protein JXR96_07245 [Deltaproteobacteria bacterium]|nr:hypothetical protein [Deltaproteobacteria bacterium]
MRRILLFSAAVVAVSSSVRAETSNFELGGKIYTKWLYRNNTSQGVLSYGNPFTNYDENQSGDNGIGSELEINIKGRVSDVVEAGARLKSRFGSTWHDFWENGNIRYTETNTSGESMGMDHAEYLKLRGYWVKLNKPFPGVSHIHVGSSDLGMFNPWTVGKIRYIDRDNAKGIFVHGRPVADFFAYDLGIIALPKLWVGPGWSTGLGEETQPGSVVVSPFWTQDWAYALKLRSQLADWMSLEMVGMISLDYEADIYDPDAPGSLNPADAEYCRAHPDDNSRCTDHAVDFQSRYTNAVITLAADIEPFEDYLVNFIGGWSASRINRDFTANGVASNQGYFPMVYDDVNDFATVLRVSMLDAFGVEELNVKAEGFYIGEHWTSTFGARREADVLLTDGFIEGGQLPTLNLANEFIDFDEDFYESCIGWQGGTLLLEYTWEALTLKLESTFIGYNTNGQDRPVFGCSSCENPIYPNFLYSEGYTDVDLYDYENPRSIDRGRDPRSVFREDQDRWTFIGVFWASYVVDVGEGLEISAKFKQIVDHDARDTGRSDDDYAGHISIGRLSFAYPITDTIKLRLGGQFDWWDEDHREGNPAAGYAYYQTTKIKPFLLLTFNYGGAALRYYLEYVWKDQWRGDRYPEQLWGVFRSKATLEVSW